MRWFRPPGGRFASTAASPRSGAGREPPTAHTILGRARPSQGGRAGPRRRLRRQPLAGEWKIARARAAISGSRPRRNRSIKDRAAPSDRSPCALGFLARRRRGLSPPPRRWRGFREARGGALRLRRLARARRALRSAPPPP